MSGRGPFGQEAALAVGIGTARLNLGVDRRINEVQQREEAPEGVPEPRVGVHVTRQHLAVVGAVMQDIAVLVDLVELAGKERRAVKA